MTLDAFLTCVRQRNPLNTPEIQQFMDEMSEEARRVTFELNGSYHTPDQVRDLLSKLFGHKVDPTLRVFPPFYSDFGKNITIGKKRLYQRLLPLSRITAASCSGDGCQIGHNVGLRHAQPRPRSRRAPHDPSGTDRAGTQRLGRLERDDPARGHHRATTPS